MGEQLVRVGCLSRRASRPATSSPGNADDRERWKNRVTVPVFTPVYAIRGTSPAAARREHGPPSNGGTQSSSTMPRQYTRDKSRSL